MREKAAAAGIAVLVALLGIVTGLKWLTVVALVLWVVAMVVFGTGKRKPENEEAASE